MAGLAIVRVDWADAHAGPEHWTALDEMEDDGEYIVSSVGYLLPTSDGGKDGHVTLVQSITPHDDVDHTLHIPVGMVRKCVVLCNAQDVVS